MRFENTNVYGMDAAIRGMRNPLQSHDKMDSKFNEDGQFIIGKNDLKLATKLIHAGSPHRKFLRQIFVSVDITAPIYWWKEMDTYKIGTTANSTSTMHKLKDTPITLDCFEIDDFENIEYPYDDQRPELKHFVDPDIVQMVWIPYLEFLRKKYNETRDLKYWKELIRWLPESWLQTRTWTANYEAILNIVGQRWNHKLTEWREDFISWVNTLPYADKFLIREDS